MTVLDEEAAFDREFEAKLASRRARRLVSLGVRPVAWLALVPVWSERVARACQFPIEGQDLDAFLDQAERAGLLRRREPLDPAELAWQRVEVWLRAVPSLPAPLTAEAIAAVAALEHDGLRVEALAAMAGLLPEAVLPTAATMARTVRDPVTRVAALAAVAGARPPPADTMEATRADTVIRALADEAVDTALSISTPAARAEALLYVLPLLDESGESGPDGPAERERVLATLLTLTEATDLEPAWRRRILVAVVSALSPAQINAALAAARELPNPEQLEVLLAVAPHLPVPQRHAALSEADKLSSGLTEPNARTLALARLAPALADAGQYERAGQLAGAIADHRVRARVLGQVAGSARASGNIATASQVAQVLTDSTDTDPELRVRDLSAAAHGLSGVGDRAEAVKLAERALGAVPELPAGAAASVPLTQVAMAVAETGVRSPGAASEAAVEAAHQIDDARARCQRLTDLLPYLAGEQQAAALDLAMAAARAVDDGADRAFALAGLLPHLPEAKREPILREALAALEQAAGEATFWMPDAARTEVLPDLLDELRREPVLDLYVEVGEIARRLRQAGRELPMPADLARWAELAIRMTGRTAQKADTGPEAATRFFDSKLTELVKVRDADQAAAWVRAGTLLGQTIGGELEVIALNGMRRVELLHREAQDQRHLARFLERLEQVRAFEALLDGPNNRWALHYRGVAGVGKTMLLRYLTAKVTPLRGIPVSRIDFDHLSPDYPLRRPGQLLLELADELRAYAQSSRADDLFLHMRTRLVRLHETLQAEPPPADHPLASLGRSDFDRALGTFCEFIEQLPQPVVLMLDTCEELAKLPPVGAMLPAVEATFTILEGIRARAPTVRVVFAGRRFLARAGHGWRLREGAASEGRALLPERKDYLRLHEIRGFTDAEAGRYLDQAMSGGLEPGLRQAILDQSLEDTPPDEVDRDSPAGPGPGTEPERRHNPFVMSLFADWAHEDPTLTAEQVSSGESDAYVETRIVGRLREHDVRSLLPAVTLLRRFDRTMLRPAFDGDDDAFEAAYRAIGNMEWLDYQPDEALRTTFLNIHPGLLGRLEAFYRHDRRRQQLDTARERLGAGLARLLGRPPGQLGVDYVDAALRLLPAGQAARLWDDLVQRVTDEGYWGWARTVTDRLLGEDGAIHAVGHPLRASVLALQCAVFVHEQPIPLGKVWAEVEQATRAYPDPVTANWLRQRARLGRVAAGENDDRLPRLAGDLSELLDAEATTDRPQHTLFRTTDVRAVSFASLPNGEFVVVTADGDGTIWIWDAIAVRLLGTLTGHEDAVLAAAPGVLPDGRTVLATGGRDGTVRLWDVTNGQPLQVLQGHTDSVWSVTFATLSDGAVLLATVGADRTLRLWDATSGWPHEPITGHGDQVRSVASGTLADNQVVLATGSIDRTVRLWDATTGEHLRTFHCPTAVSAVTVARQADRQTFLAACCEHDTVLIWRLDTDGAAPEPTVIVARDLDWVRSATFATLPDGRLVLATGNRNYAARLWDPETGELLHTFTGQGEPVRSVAFATLPSGQVILVTGGSEGGAWLWDVPSRRATTEQLLASFCAAAEAVIGRAERTGDLTGLAGLRRTWRFPRRADLSAELRAMLTVTQIRAESLVTGRAPDSAAFRESLRALADAATAGQQRQHWADWRAPDPIIDRVRLEATRLIPPSGPFTIAEQNIRDWWVQAIPRTDRIDAERLLSALLARRLAWETVPAFELEELYDADLYDPGRQPSCPAHHAVPPLFVSVACGWLALGEGERALYVLDRRAREAEATGRDPFTGRDAERAKLEVLRRQRMGDAELELVDRMLHSDQPEQLGQAWALAALTAGTPTVPFGIPNWPLHEQWRAQTRVDAERAETAVVVIAGRIGRPDSALRAEDARWSSRTAAGGRIFEIGWDDRRGLILRVDGRTYGARPPVSSVQWLLVLDWWEAVTLITDSGLPSGPFGLPEGPFKWGWLSAQPRHYETTARLSARAWALQREEDDDQGQLEEWAQAVGPRRMAELALDEGELLALRLPIHGARLLDRAAAWFGEVDDLAGELIATICAHLAVLRAGRPLPRRNLALVTLLYQRFRAEAAGAGLPDPGADLGYAERRDWRGWLQRLALLLKAANTRRDTAQPSAEDQLQERLRIQDVNLPVELDTGVTVAGAAPEDWPVTTPQPSGSPVLEPELPPTTPQPSGSPVLEPELPPTTPAMPRRRRSRTWLVAVALIVSIGILIGAVLVLGDTGLSGLLGSSPEPQNNFLWPLLAATLVAAGTLAGLIMLWRRWRAELLAAHAEPVLEIWAPRATDPSRLAGPLNMKLTRPATPGVEPILLSASAFTAFVLRDATAEAYRTTAARLEPEIVGSLRELAGRHRRRRTTLVLRIWDPLLQQVPWEALLANALAGQATIERGFLHFTRLGEPLPATAPRAPEDIAIMVLAAPTWRRLVENSWAQHGSVTLAERSFPADVGSVVHVIGSPVETASGVRIRIGGGAAGRRAGQSAEEEVRGAMLLGPDDLGRPRGLLVVVQKEPAELPNEGGRGQTEREQVGELRLLAAGVSVAGAPAVLLLPSLPEDAAAMVLERLAILLARTRPEARAGALPRIVGELRALVAREVAYRRRLDEPDWRELALDITLFQRRVQLAEGGSSDA
jgi:WD40 repeat protein